MKRWWVLVVAVVVAVAGPARARPARPSDSRPTGTSTSTATASAPATGSAPAAVAAARAKAEQVARMHRQAIGLFGAKDIRGAKAVLEQILQINPEDSLAWYNLACADACLGSSAAAMASLNTAVEYGFCDFRHIERDSDLASLRDSPAYRQLLERKEEIQRSRAEKIRETLRRQYGQDYICQVDHERKLVFATDIDTQCLDELKDTLTAFAQAAWTDLFAHPFEQYVTVILPRDAPIGRPGVQGFYSHGTRLLRANNIGPVLVHEFTHALHHADQDGMGQSHPIWVVEGLASLMEYSSLQDGHIVAEDNYRLNGLRELVRRGRTAAWREFVRWDQGRFLKDPNLSYGQSRYMMMYLHRKGLLKAWYDAYTAAYRDDPTGAMALEQVFGQSLEAIEKDWSKWVLSLRPPPMRLLPNAACLGVRVEAQVDGLRIAEVVADGGAERAGLKAGDCIVALDGERIVEPAEMIMRVAECKVGQQVEVRYRRDGLYHQVVVTLTALPAPPPASRPASSSAPASSSRPARRAG